MKPIRFALLFFTLLVSVWSYPSQSQTKQQNDLKKKVNILFVGNSLTYTHNLPKLVKQRAEKKFGIIVKTEMIAAPNYALTDHWQDGNVQEKIRSGGFDYVIVQQGPSSQSEGRKLLFEATEKFSTLCRNKGSQLCMFMVWPSLDNYDTFDGVIQNYTEAAELYGAILLPVGAYWKSHFDETRNFDYYGPDVFHPSLKGSHKAADVIVYSLFK